MISIILFINNPGLSQSLENIDAKIDSLLKIKDYYLNLIDEINIKIKDLETKKNAILNEEPEFLETTTVNAAGIYENPDNSTKIVCKIAKGEKIEILDYQTQYYKVKYSEYIGWISRFDIGITRKIHDLKIQTLVQKYGIDIAKDIIDEKIWLEMTKEMVIDSWGLPQKVMRTVLKSGENEQWYYENTYLYFQNGKLISWQDLQK